MEISVERFTFVAEHERTAACMAFEWEQVLIAAAVEKVPVERLFDHPRRTRWFLRHSHGMFSHITHKLTEPPEMIESGRAGIKWCEALFPRRHIVHRYRLRSNALLSAIALSSVLIKDSLGLNEFVEFKVVGI